MDWPQQQSTVKKGGPPAITYGSCTGSCNSTSPTISNTAMSANNIYDKPGEVVAKQNANNVAQINYTYDSHGNLTSTQYWTGSTFIGQTSPNTYTSRGLPLTSYDVANYETTYTYSSAGYGDGCGTIFPFPTQIKDIGTGMSTNYAYDCTGGVMTAAQNYNGTSSQVDYGYTTSPGTGAIADPFWRLMSTTDPLGSAVWNNYPTGASPDQSSTLFKYNSNNSENETFYDTDGYGRLT
jgi:YD repeat-containing protein